MKQTRIELIGVFNPLPNPVSVAIDFIDPDKPIVIGHDFKVDQQLMDALDANGWTLISTQMFSNLLYGVYQKECEI